MNDDTAIQRVIARYCHTLDDGAFAEFADLWADDAEFVLRGTVTTGRAAIREVMVGMQPPERRGRHLTMNSVVDVDGDHAHALSDFVFFGRDPELGAVPRFVGRYVDQFVRTDAGWRFQRREIEFF